MIGTWHEDVGWAAERNPISLGSIERYAAQLSQARSHVVHNARRLSSRKRADAVDKVAAGSHQVCGGGQDSSLKIGQFDNVFGCDTPASISPSSQSADARTWRVDKDSIEAGRWKRRGRAVGLHHVKIVDLQSIAVTDNKAGSRKALVCGNDTHASLGESR